MKGSRSRLWYRFLSLSILLATSFDAAEASTVPMPSANHTQDDIAEASVSMADAVLFASIGAVRDTMLRTPWSSDAKPTFRRERHALITPTTWMKSNFGQPRTFVAVLDDDLDLEDMHPRTSRARGEYVIFVVRRKVDPPASWTTRSGYISRVPYAVLSGGNLYRNGIGRIRPEEREDVRSVLQRAIVGQDAEAMARAANLIVVGARSDEAVPCTGVDGSYVNCFSVDVDSVIAGTLAGKRIIVHEKRIGRRGRNLYYLSKLSNGAYGVMHYTAGELKLRGDKLARTGETITERAANIRRSRGER